MSDIEHSAVKPKKPKKQKKYATLQHPTIEAAVEGLYYFSDKPKALARLEKIRQTFVVSRCDEPQEISAGSLVLWIRGYGLSEADDFGYRGHFARLSVQKGRDGLWSIVAEKLEVPLHRHPQRQRPSFTHPDWNYPVMRGIKSGRIYDSYDQALGELETLHIDFPEVTIPNKGKLHLIVYEGKQAEHYTQKYLLELVAIDETRYQIRATAKAAPPKAAPKLKQKRSEAAADTLGAFTAKLRGERFRKK